MAVNPICEASEYDNLFARGDNILDAFGNGAELGLVEGCTNFRQPSQELRIVWLGGVVPEYHERKLSMALRAALLVEMSTGTQDRTLGGKSKTSSLIRRMETSFIRRFNSSRLDAPVVTHP